MSLRKGATFHAPSSSFSSSTTTTTSTTTSTPPSTTSRSLPYHLRPPRRAQSTLDDVVDAHKRRVALTLGDIDRGLAATEDTNKTSPAFPDDADPVPRGVLDHTIDVANTSYGPIMDSAVEKATGRSGLRPRMNRRPARFTDSALGSSVESASGKQQDKNDQSSQTATASAITRSHASTLDGMPALRVRAVNRIREHILRPLLANAALKDFHPLVRDCPRRIQAREIVCLRDLEKTLVFMAPVSSSTLDVAGGLTHAFSLLKARAKSADLYLEFCRSSIYAIQATVDFFTDREQTRPSDRPYTSGYFVDLVDQIRQYAQQVQAAKDGEEKEAGPKSYVPCIVTDGPIRVLTVPSRTDVIRLHGGLTQNGRPAELVHVKEDGKAVSLATGLPVDIDEDSKTALQMKRSLSQGLEDDEAILRSMARRKRSASAEQLAPKRCRAPGCDKEFKRPCDLTKHEKTHSRPWKCPVSTCKYHEYGWPTEKEMDRHHNDKHSAAPALFECHYKPCPYRSKRESNCKQHMEKAHGWQYVRSKNIGRNKDRPEEAATATSHGLPTPQTTNVQTPSSDGQGVNTPDEDMFDMPYDRAAMFDPQNQINFPEYNSDSELAMFAPPPLQLDFSPSSDFNNPSSAGRSPYTAGPSAAQDPFQEAFPEYGSSGVDFNLYDSEDLYSARVQLPTSDHEVFRQLEAGAFEIASMPLRNQPAPHISPLGHGNHMLYSPTSLQDMDEGFEEFLPSDPHRLGGSDFPLFPASGSGTIASSAPSVFFGEIPKPVNVFPGTTAQELLDFYAATTQAAVHGHHPVTMMDWSTDDQFNSYGQH